MTTTTERELYIWEKNHIEVCNEMHLFKNKEVLEVGGTTPESVTQTLGVKSWTCIDTWNGINRESINYRILNSDITQLDLADKSFDFIFSTNAFEHINNLKAGLENMKRMLKPGGYLSALFGPIWSSCKGHHLWNQDENGVWHTFEDNIIEPWSHLLYSQEEMKEYLNKIFSETSTNSIMQAIYTNFMLNHLFYDDYFNIINNLGMEIIEFRDWHSPIQPDNKTLKILESKWGKRNYSTISIKILLKSKE